MGGAVANQICLHIVAFHEVPAGAIDRHPIAVASGGDDLQWDAWCSVHDGPLRLTDRALAVVEVHRVAIQQVGDCDGGFH